MLTATLPIPSRRSSSIHRSTSEEGPKRRKTLHELWIGSFDVDGKSVIDFVFGQTFRFARVGRQHGAEFGRS